VCGAVNFECKSLDVATPPVRCHCQTCRRSHTAPFAALLPIDSLDVVSPSLEACTVRCSDRCDKLGEVERLFCPGCRSTVATVAPSSAGDGGGGGALLALGCLEDESLPPATALRWQREYDDWEPAQGPSWWRTTRVTPSDDANSGNAEKRHHSVATDDSSRGVMLRGGCACGGCSFHSALDGTYA
jgi:hypothetical protein